MSSGEHGGTQQELCRVLPMFVFEGPRSVRADPPGQASGRTQDHPSHPRADRAHQE